MFRAHRNYRFCACCTKGMRVYNPLHVCVRTAHSFRIIVFLWWQSLRPYAALMNFSGAEKTTFTSHLAPALPGCRESREMCFFFQVVFAVFISCDSYGQRMRPGSYFKTRSRNVMHPSPGTIKQKTGKVAGHRQPMKHILEELKLGRVGSHH